MQNKHQIFFFSFGRPNFGGGGGGSPWLGQIPKFFQKFDLKASLIVDKIQRYTIQRLPRTTFPAMGAKTAVEKPREASCIFCSFQCFAFFALVVEFAFVHLFYICIHNISFLS